jgi:hypothetical protein
VDLIADAFKDTTAGTTLFDFLFRQGRNVARAASDTLRSRTDHLLGEALVDPNASSLQRLLAGAARPSSPLRITVRPSAVINATNATIE